MVTVVYNAYCVISVEGDHDTYNGKTAGSHSWKVGATVNSLLGTLFHVIITRPGTDLNFDISFMTGIQILGAMTQSCYIGSRGIRNHVIRGPYCNVKKLHLNTTCLYDNILPYIGKSCLNHNAIKYNEK